MPRNADQPLDAGVAAAELAGALNKLGVDYAIGGAIARTFKKSSNTSKHLTGYGSDSNSSIFTAPGTLALPVGTS